MKKLIFLFCVIAGLETAAQTKDYTVSLQGLGAIKLGMSQEALEKLLGQKMILDNHLDTVNNPTWDTAKLKYRNIPVQLEFDRSFTADGATYMRLIGIRFSSPLCKTASGIGIGSDKLKVIAAYDNLPIAIQPGFANYFETEHGKGKSTISITDDYGTYMMRLFLLNNKVVSFELKGLMLDQLTPESNAAQ